MLRVQYGGTGSPGVHWPEIGDAVTGMPTLGGPVANRPGLPAGHVGTSELCADCTWARRCNGAIIDMGAARLGVVWMLEDAKTATGAVGCAPGGNGVATGMATTARGEVPAWWPGVVAPTGNANEPAGPLEVARPTEVPRCDGEFVIGMRVAIAAGGGTVGVATSGVAGVAGVLAAAENFASDGGHCEVCTAVAEGRTCRGDGALFTGGATATAMTGAERHAGSEEPAGVSVATRHRCAC
mmetsp:Transcript_28668/g.78807  ORF Transcript_28668/g.78807 Transcript_28668/m.78807 type:complete len:240 (-) Transcript_28668:1324-2043(-)